MSIHSHEQQTVPESLPLAYQEARELVYQGKISDAIDVVLHAIHIDPRWTDIEKNHRFYEATMFKLQKTDHTGQEVLEWIDTFI